MLSSNPYLSLPKGEDLPSSDGLPVDNELQIFIPNLLASILGLIWGDRLDWFFGINMGIYYATGVNPRVPIVPDGFLSLGVERVKNNKLRESYVVWEENNIVPVMVLEVVSKTPGGEYEEKMTKYTQLGALYYLIYNPEFWRRDGHEPFEMYRLEAGEYQRQFGEPFWMPEVGLGIGRGIGSYRGIRREWLYWYDRQDNRLESPEDKIIVQQQQNSELQKQNSQLQKRNSKLQSLLERYQEQFGRLEED